MVALISRDGQFSACAVVVAKKLAAKQKDCRNFFINTLGLSVRESAARTVPAGLGESSSAFVDTAR
jgi:hypothetical protein